MPSVRGRGLRMWLAAPARRLATGFARSYADLVEPLYRSIIGLARLTFVIQGLKFTITGAEHIPARGGAVITLNHTGYGEFVYAGIPVREHKRYVRYLAKKEVFENKISGTLMRALGHIAVDRAAGAQAYEAAVAALRAGELVGVYPEATISRSFELKEFKSGAARMALEAQVPIVPMIVWGAQRIWTKGHPKRLGRTKTPIAIAVGQPIPPEGTPAELTARVHAAMEQLLLDVQSRYEHTPGAYWVPARLGGSAPSPAAADALEAAEAAAKAARKAGDSP